MRQKDLRIPDEKELEKIERPMPQKRKLKKKPEPITAKIPAEDPEIIKLRKNLLENALAERLKMASGLEDMWRRQVKRGVIV